MSSNKHFFERSKRSFQKFCDGTSMHGFAELYYTKNIFWLSFWMIIIGAAIGVTVYQVYQAVYQFIDQPTMTVIQLATPDDILYPTLKVCYPHWIYWVDWEKGIKMNFTKESILYGLSYMSAIYSANEFNESEAKENFILKMKDNHMTTIREFYTAITMDNWEMMPDLNETVVSASISIDFERYQTKFCQIVEGKNIPQLITELQQNSILNDQSRKTSKSNFLQFSVLTRPKRLTKYVNELEYAKYIESCLIIESSFIISSVSDIEKVFLPTTVYPNTYDTNGVIVTNQNDLVTISMKTSIHKWKNTPQMPCKVDLKWITMNNTCSHECYNVYNSAYLHNCYGYTFLQAVFSNNDIPSKNLISAGIIFIDIKNDTQITTPYAINTTDTFQTNFAEIFEQSMNETSYSNASNDNTWNSTTVECILDYQEINQKFSNCTKACDSMTGCQVYTFDVNSQTVSLYRTMAGKEVNYIGDGFPRYTTVKIEYATENEVLMMIEQDTQTWEGFVGNVGGLLGIWTGASILSFIQLVYLCFCTECDPQRIHRESRKLKEPKETKIINVATVPR